MLVGRLTVREMRMKEGHVRWNSAGVGYEVEGSEGWGEEGGWGGVGVEG